MKTKNKKKAEIKDIFADYNITAIAKEIVDHVSLKSGIFEARILVLNTILKKEPVYTKDEILVAMKTIIRSMPEDYEAGMQIAKMAGSWKYSCGKLELYDLFNKFLCTWLMASRPAFIKDYTGLKKDLDDGKLFSFFQGQDLAKMNEEALYHVMLSQILLLCNEMNPEIEMGVWYAASCFMRDHVSGEHESAGYLMEIFNTAHVKITELKINKIKELYAENAFTRYVMLIDQNFLKHGHFAAEGANTKKEIIAYLSIARQEALDDLGKKGIGRMIPIRVNLLKLNMNTPLKFWGEALDVIEQKLLEAFKAGNEFPVTDKGKLDKLSEEIGSGPTVGLRRDKNKGLFLM